jgi:hypothetical protein
MPIGSSEQFFCLMEALRNKPAAIIFALTQPFLNPNRQPTRVLLENWWTI